MKVLRLFFLIIPFISACTMLQAQVTKKALTWDDVVSWKQITDKAVSDNGKWVFCKMAPWRGDATVYLYNEMVEEKASSQPV